MDFKSNLLEKARASSETPPPPIPDTTTLPGPPAATDLVIVIQPGQCRPWTHHDRNRAALNEETCKDLLASIRQRGQNEQPIIVRSIDEPSRRYEIIAGVRRHWCVTHLTENGHPNVKLLGIVRDDLNDTDAFQIGDLENRNRKDITTLERARSYEHAREHLFKSEREMSETLLIARRTLQLYRNLSSLDQIVIDCFAQEEDLTLSIAADLAAGASTSQTKASMIERAKRITRIQMTRRKRQKPALSGSLVRDHLLRGSQKSNHEQRNVVIKGPDNLPIARLTSYVKKGNPILRIVVLTPHINERDLKNKATKFIQTLYTPSKSS